MIRSIVDLGHAGGARVPGESHGEGGCARRKAGGRCRGCGRRPSRLVRG